ncbi:MAG: DUF362 domain-containing protein [Methylacidiphilales bacterium]|nr:DUF362 domain-containing protein [Candidatus Methylacidiphilales bacterium]
MNTGPGNKLAWLAMAGVVALAVAASSIDAQTAGSKQATERLPLSPVILVERPGVVREFSADPQQVAQMVDHALLKLTSAQDIATAWKRLGITPQDVVGIKITTAGGPALCTHQPLVQAICAGLELAGVPASQIIIWDKFQDKMRPAGYALRASRGAYPAIESVVPANYYDPSVFYRNDMAGNLIWGDFMFNQSLNMYDPVSNQIVCRSYFTKFVTQTCTKLINVPVLTDNQFVGISGCMSSLALGSVDNNRRFQGPPTYGTPAIDDILDRDFIRQKVVVHILDALVAQCAGGPSFNPQFCESWGALYVGRDPVAIDSLVLPKLEQMRRTMNVPPIGNTANYIQMANFYSLGTTDRRRIQLVRIP